MSSRDLGALVTEFRPKAQTLINNCRARGIEMRPSETLRDPFEQARLWRQSRSREEVERKIAQLREAGAAFLAQCIERVGPQSGRPVTNAVPGLSWHQWGESIDCFWLVDGRAEWSTDRLVNGVNGYHVYVEEAQRLGLTAGGVWSGLKDWPHVQLRSASSPLRALSLTQIDREMETRFGATS